MKCRIIATNTPLMLDLYTFITYIFMQKTDCKLKLGYHLLIQVLFH